MKFKIKYAAAAVLAIAGFLAPTSKATATDPNNDPAFHYYGTVKIVTKNLLTKAVTPVAGVPVRISRFDPPTALLKEVAMETTDVDGVARFDFYVPFYTSFTANFSYSLNGGKQFIVSTSPEVLSAGTFEKTIIRYAK